MQQVSVHTMSEENKRKQPRTPAKQLFSGSVGNFLNDLVNKYSLSFGLIYYMKVANLSSSPAGLVLVIGQVANFVANVLFGYCCDKVDVPFLSSRRGRRKTWHLIGSILTALFLLLAFSLCLICIESSPSWLRFAYFTIAYGFHSFWYGAAEMGYISFIPELAKNQDEVVILHTLR